MSWYLQHNEHKDLKFKILKINKAEQRAVLLGATGRPFEQSIAQKDLDIYGYTPVNIEEQADAVVA